MGCKVTFTVTSDPEFHSSSWWAKSADGFTEIIQKQLEAAKAIWPELAQYELRKKSQSKATSGKVGGEARATTLGPERRAEIAKIAANARWGKTDPSEPQ